MAGFFDFAEAFVPKQGQKRILSDRTRIYVKSNGKNVRVGEIDNFNATKDDEIRRFIPVGETRETGYLKDKGYSLSISGGKVDWNLARLMHRQELLYHNRQPGETPNALNPLLFLDGNKLSKTRCINPVFEIEHSVVHPNGTIEIYTYEDVILYGYTIDVNGDLDVLKESVKGFSPKKTRNNGSIFTDEILSPGVNIIVEQLILDILKSDERTSPKIKTGLIDIAINTPPRG